jgi:hypothetical protein
VGDVEDADENGGNDEHDLRLTAAMCGLGVARPLT